MQNIYHHKEGITLESGAKLTNLDIAYHTFGTLSPNRDNVIWVCHALTANSDVADWWLHTVEKGKFLDPDKYFIICANVLGSHYGTTSPLSVNPETGKPWYLTFPKFTIRDMVQCHIILAEHLGIHKVKLLIGSSLGAFQCMEWCVMKPDFAEKAALIATAPLTKPWAAAFNESQRMAIEADSTFLDKSPFAGAKGLATARSIAMLSYRGDKAYNITQNDKAERSDPFSRRVHSYQQHQGDKLAKRFNAFSYYRLSQAVDSHDISRGRESVEKVLADFKPQTLIVAISSDILFPPSDHREFVEYIPDVEYHVIDSQFGHDGFLVEHQKLNAIILNFLNSKSLK